MSNLTNTNGALFTLVQSKFQYTTYIICGLASAVFNVIIAIGIPMSNKPKTRFNIILLFLLVSRILAGMNISNYGIYRLCKSFGLFESTPRIVCAVIVMALVNSTLELLYLLYLAIDRAMALFLPIRYRVLTWRTAVRDCAAFLTVVWIFKVCELFGNDPPLLSNVACNPIYQALPTVMQEFYAQSNFALLVLLLVAYVLIMIGLKMESRRLMRSSAQNQAALITFKRHAAVMPTVKSIILVHGGFTLSSKVATLITTAKLPESVSNSLLFASGMCISVESIVNVVVLLWTNAEIRQMTRGLFPARGKVAPTVNNVA